MQNLPIDQLTIAFEAHPKPETQSYSYGTAGFRMHASKLDSVVFKVGILAALRSKLLNSQTIGIMVTASHNPPEDNGVKIVDPMGEMLPQEWEPLATELANAESFDTFVEVLQKIVHFGNIDLSKTANVIIARDTRESGPSLVSSAKDGVFSIDSGAIWKDFGELTTPQLHYLTRSSNDSSFGVATETGYNDKLVNTLEKILKLWGINEPLEITVDAANGIGSPKLINLKSDLINCTVVNSDIQDPHALNVNCGADYVKTNQKLPANVNDPIPFKLYSSFDGDADRVIFYYVDDQSNFRLLDGDRIATLLATFISTLLSNLNESISSQLKLGIVQTAYANGSSTKYIESTLKVPVSFTPTGVKHLHHKAQEYDIGVYFEANGHGTVVFSQHYTNLLANYKTSDKEELKSLETLKSLVDLINQTVGDSISDLFAVLVALKITNQSSADWSSSYRDLPNRLFKVVVKDRFLYKTINAERELSHPIGLQDKINAVVSKYDQGRSFVRASGTEDAVRVYAEADTVEHCIELGEAVCQLVRESTTPARSLLSSLPQDILSNVFSNLNTTDLLSLTKSSRRFSMIAQPLLFRSIKLTNESTKDQGTMMVKSTLISSFKGFLQFVYSILNQNDLGPLVEELKFDDLDRSIQYIKLSSVTDSGRSGRSNYWNLKISEVLSIYELEHLSGNLPFDLTDMTLFDCLVILLNYTTNLKKLFVPSLNLRQIDAISSSLDSLQDLTITLKHDESSMNVNQFADLKSLKKLTIQFESGSDKLLSHLSDVLYKSGILKNLDSLELIYLKLDFNEVILPTWISFFSNLPSSTSVFQSLKSFKMYDCQFDDQQVTLIKHLIKCIPFQQITSLYLKIFEYSHKSKRHQSESLSHFEKHENFTLNLLSPYITSLKSLTLKPTKNCLQCQFQSIVQFLTNHHNLHHLSISMHTLNSQNFHHLNTIISQTQKQLKSLVLFDENMHMKLINSFKSWYVHQNELKFDSYKNFEIEVAAQDKEESVYTYNSATFEKFNKNYESLLILLWKSILADYKLDELMSLVGCIDGGFKLYGFNFRVVKERKLIQVYVCESVGYKDVMFHY
ncbi:hypothetical protein CANARDRAFT_9743 [[Candida] arabinofermentans NRRL YB-2248]|uniref:Phosphoacetylglucosamine mutase n=1 Tax=[Candida] arabinofermentans NRRL YB-2248 TaxID=983967 RepID=A0A1E4SV79_9ASCO|nr:hypothetical protein CANARDRAFT_9743 [[Candida] arabinofermentans NRRL YB-2248]